MAYMDVAYIVIAYIVVTSKVVGCIDMSYIGTAYSRAFYRSCTR